MRWPWPGPGEWRRPCWPPSCRPRPASPGSWWPGPGSLGLDRHHPAPAGRTRPVRLPRHRPLPAYRPGRPRRPGRGPALGPQRGQARVVTLYDLIPLRAPRHYLSTPAHEERYRARAAWVASADLVLAISEHTRQEAIELLGCAPDRVVTVGAGVSPYFCPGRRHRRRAVALPPGCARRPPLRLDRRGQRRPQGHRTAHLSRRPAGSPGLGSAPARRRRPHGRLAPAAHRHRARRRSGRSAGSDRAGPGRAAASLLSASRRHRDAVAGGGIRACRSWSRPRAGTPALASASTALAEVSATPLAGFDPTDTAAIADAIAAAPVRRRAPGPNPGRPASPGGRLDLGRRSPPGPRPPWIDLGRGELRAASAPRARPDQSPWPARCPLTGVESGPQPPASWRAARRCGVRSP